VSTYLQGAFLGLILVFLVSPIAKGAPPPSWTLLSRTNLLQFVSTEGKVEPVRDKADWEQRRASIRLAMQEVMGPLPGPKKRCPLNVQVEEEIDCGQYVRRFLSYSAEPGGEVPAYLLIPKSVLTNSRKAPAILALHQTHSQGQKVVVGLANSTNDEYGVALVKRGFVVLAPPYPLLANYQPDLKALGYESGTMKAIWDNIRGLDLLESLTFVRTNGFGAIGHSLGGHNGIYTAVFDERIKAVVSSCGFDSYRDYMNGDIRGWTSQRYMPRLLEYRATIYPFDFYEVIAALAPRRLFVNAPLRDSNFQSRSVDGVCNAARDVYDLYAAPSHLQVYHPDCAHLFPRDLQEKAFALFEEVLR
jgi:hypothetical protein